MEREVDGRAGQVFVAGERTGEKRGGKERDEDAWRHVLSGDV
jgi:hypothetical protein